MIGTSDQGKEIEIACANCTVFRISADGVALLSNNGETNRPIYSLLARRCPVDHVIVIGTNGCDATHECTAIKRLKSLKVRGR